ncbi:Piso0_004515 [Millerozyma farinosa CBS 7064]|uniref:Piso0_004515 protein n=1 Tax=Pichia sorbitophila (strain ATCC MYA-4447 / BCRC 22081 / CBS 7064 / NBRC 10061 / NRRL Y-12695) TaxID=559304 RepID=G8Y5N8_PICSO|nr:Piso0_004515 [Millerozyma farinosa CBS 7064]CCE84949.1 Piso0_004515 [Millerozyma farinosa CBS 7064]
MCAIKVFDEPTCFSSVLPLPLVPELRSCRSCCDLLLYSRQLHGIIACERGLGHRSLWPAGTCSTSSEPMTCADSGYCRRRKWDVCARIEIAAARGSPYG